jgi:hypothetical protein
MSPLKSLFVAVPVAIGLLAAPAAHAEWRGGHGGWHGPERHGDWHGGHGPGIAGAVIGLGAAAIVGGVLASQAYARPPAVVYAPPPVYVAPPPVVYAPPPVVYAPVPAYGY